LWKIIVATDKLSNYLIYLLFTSVLKLVCSIALEKIQRKWAAEESECLILNVQAA